MMQGDIFGKSAALLLLLFLALSLAKTSYGCGSGTEVEPVSVATGYAPESPSENLRRQKDQTYETLAGQMANGDIPAVTAYLRGHADFDINTIGPSGRTLLHEAVLVGNIAMIKLLFQKNAQAGIKDKNGETPFALAQRVGQTKAANYLHRLVRRLVSSRTLGEDVP